MTKAVLISLSLVLASHLMTAQDFLSWQLNDRYFSLQVGTGTSTYYGDLKHTSNLRRQLSNLNIGVEARLLNKLSVRVQLTRYNLKGSDKQAADSSYAQQRNLDFRSKNMELNLSAVLYMRKYRGNYYRRYNWDPYIFGGIGVTYFDPYTKLAGEEIRLSPLRTEGKDYSQYALTLPVGAGIKFKVNDFTNFTLEASYHFTSSDYLDDVSRSYASSYPNFTSALLANRKDELPGIVNADAYENTLIPGGRRGDPGTKDSYLFLKVQLEFFLPPDLFSGKKPLFKKSSR